MGLLSKIKGNLGNNLPPMISRAGNDFTLRDAAGNERPSTKVLDVVFVDGNTQVSKTFREDPNYNPNDPLPPDCFSDNGEAPSNYALKPQSASCHNCRWNVRGSRLSKVDGKPIKACADSQKLAVLVVGEQPILYQLVITSGNLKAFRAYAQSVEGNKYDLDEIVTRLSFVPKMTGMLQFEAVSEADDEYKDLVGRMQGTPTARFVTGESDEPIGALPAAKPVERLAPAREHVNVAPPIQEDAPLPDEAPKAAGPTREQLEAQLREMRAKEDAAKPKRRDGPRLATVEATGNAAPIADKEVPAFLRRKDAPPSNSAFGMTSNAPPPPDDVQKLINEQPGAKTFQARAEAIAEAKADLTSRGNGSLGERVGKAFGLPLRP